MNKGGYEVMEPFEQALSALSDYYNEELDRYELCYMDVFALYPHIIEFLRNQTDMCLRYSDALGKWLLEREGQ